MKRILIAAVNPEQGMVVHERLAGEYAVDTATDAGRAMDMFRRHRYEFTFIDVNFLAGAERSGEGRILLADFRAVYPGAIIVVMCDTDRLRETVGLVKKGADNYLVYPIDPHEVDFILGSMVEAKRMESELDLLRGSFWKEDVAELVQTRSPAMQRVYEQVKAVTATAATVLITGETGTGKGILARVIHRQGKRADKPFISVHCGAIPDTLLESELFGHEKGAFTGAVKRKFGRFEIAEGGTVFLDEIGTVSMSAQIKLLQVLQDKTFVRVGGETVIPADVRVIAATNNDLKAMSDDGQFRKDLYFRLSVFPIEVPPLRERPEDIPLLADMFLRRLNRYYGKEISGVARGVSASLAAYDWPGNIRELENVIERAYILETSDTLTAGSFPAELMGADVRGKGGGGFDLPLGEFRERHIHALERDYLHNLMREHRGVVKDAAAAAGIGVRQLHKLLTRHGIRKEPYRNQ